MGLSKLDKKLLAICIALPLLVGGVSALLTRESMMLFESVQKPPLSPPGWLFPVVWTILYTLMGIASYLVLTSEAPKEEVGRAINVYLYQLIFCGLLGFLICNGTFLRSFGWCYCGE